MRGSRSTIPAILVCLAVASTSLLSVRADPVDAAPPGPDPTWLTVVNNLDTMPGSSSRFNSYNQPSVSEAGLVVFRARAKGGMGAETGDLVPGMAAMSPGMEPPHGIYLADLGADGEIVRVVDRTTLVPAPNNQGATFIEYPAFPRIDADTDTFAFRGNSQPVWKVGEDDDDIAGTTGIFADLGELVTAASKLGALSGPDGVPGFSVYAVPGLAVPTSFEVFPGTPSPLERAVFFKANYTEDGLPRTGVFARDLEAVEQGGEAPVRAIATSGHTTIPGSDALFGSLAAPSAAGDLVVFVGYDDEASPTLGGIFVTSARGSSSITALVGIGDAVPDGRGKPTSDRFARFGEALSFDGRYVAFWGAWGEATRTVQVVCPTEGNKARQQYCIDGSPDPDQPGIYPQTVPVHQGVFVHDLKVGKTYLAARTGETFLDFVYWGFTGKVEGSPEGDDGEPARWRSSSYVAVSGERDAFAVALKAMTPAGIHGIYLATGPRGATDAPMVMIETGMPGEILDAEDAPEGSIVTEVGIERDGFRGRWLVVNAKMLVPGAGEEAGMAGIYATEVRRP
jgi:hypothetical protein